MARVTHDDLKVRLLGYCELSLAELATRFREAGADGLRDLRGEYTIVLSTGGDVTVVTSAFGGLHYFYLVQGGRLFHGHRVLDVLRDAGLSWEWDWEALGDLAQLEHVTGYRTLHRRISQVPPGTVLSFRRQRLEIDTRPFLDSTDHEDSSPSTALDLLNDEVARWAGATPALSLSGGFDSRVVLSSLLAQGIRPHLVTMGDDECTDVVVASAIARRFGLEHQRIRLVMEDLLEHGSDACVLTNGTVPSRHWHTYVYALKAGLRSDTPFMVGTLGEFARCHYFDRGVVGRVAGLASGRAQRWYWRAKLIRHAVFRDDELSRLAAEFARASNSVGTTIRAKRLAVMSHGVFLEGLDRFYLEQVLPHFYACGIKMYLASTNWRSPFHSSEWIRAIWGLGASWKLGSNWHRFAIERNLPELLEFPEERRAVSMSRRAPPFYWTPFRRRARYVGYERSAAWFRSAVLRESLLDRAVAIEDVAERSLVEGILDEHHRGIDRTRALAFLFNLVLWSGHVGQGRAGS